MNVILRVAVALFFIFLYVPIGVIVFYSFNANPVNMLVWDGFTFDWYKGILGLGPRQLEPLQRSLYIDNTDLLLLSLKNSLIVAIVTTAFSTVAGTMTALAIGRYRFRGSALYAAGLTLPMMMPDIVLGVGLLVFFSTIGLPLGLLSIIIGQCTFLTSYVFLVVRARLAGLDPALEEASADLGASEWMTFWKVTFPQLVPGLVGAGLLAFIISMDDLVITYFIAGTGSQTLPVFIFGMIRRGIKPEINAIATLFMLGSALIVTLGFWMRTRGDISEH